MTELKELDVARTLLRQTHVMQTLREKEEDRYLKLENMMGRIYVDASDLYPGSSKEKRRGEIAKELAKEVSIIPPSRLMTVIGQALKWQRYQGALPPGAEIDLLRGVAVGKVEEEEKCSSVLANTIKFGKDCHAECVSFSPDGLVMITGTIDGFLEIWDTATAKLKKDLPYQAKEQFMLHDSPVLSVSFSRDGELICSGDQKGRIKVWRYRSGKCIRQFPNAHTHGVTSVVFSRDSGQVLSGSFDAVVRIHGLKSGRVLKELRGHTSYVNHAIYFNNGQQILSASSDGTVKIWDAKTTECVRTVRPPQKYAADEAAVMSVHLFPKNIDYFMVCNKSRSIYLMTQEGQVLKSFDVDKDSDVEFVAACVSPRGDYVYGLGSDKKLYGFQTEQRRLEECFTVSEGNPIGLVHNPLQNIVCTLEESSALKLWVP